ncbi:MAG: putative 26S proteasome regulatory subunit [Claussenomyces sp. TS43310]|nr:MAG: putative 26S proteasome regulatory subunit [Claussenomyces sp. TS43310]
MGLPLNMENLHAPTIPSGPTSGPGPNGIKTAGLTLAELQTKKNSMEAELRALSGVLDSHGVNMNTPLTTPDGFPRADIDVAQIRTTRSRIIYLKNDYKALMTVIEKKIHEHFANQIPIEPVNSEPIAGGTAVSRPIALDAPFARVNSVVASGPADSAGLKAGDLIRNFGYVNQSNHNNLKRVGDCVQGNEGRNVLVKVSRTINGQTQELQLALIPKGDWGGRGLLGCHIMPL